MGFVMKNQKTGLDQVRSDGARSAPDISAVGGAASIAVTVSYPHATDGDECRVAFYPRGADAPLQAFVRPAPIDEAAVTLTSDHPSATHGFEDVAAGDYDVYYHLRTSRGDATVWTNIAPDRLEDTPAPIRVTVGSVTQQGIADAGGFFGSAGGGVTLGL
ncbi:hypothetical protein [Tomitella fengzijianii]|uniref:Uncharacterized protein n=1 Tax=Tomitella fengzijianii TaxID=2597660 RepID=A0A516X1U8_9ACTN|nr:hypothetical protein [Tomitella fengzijianii]QDQ97049.1 hypothetical protein FO059_06515 [Tomitella fengzijianii]